MTIKTKYSIKQKVYISELKLSGLIIGIYVDDDRDYSYKIRYFNGPDPRECYFYESELTEVDKDAKLGFV